MTTFIAILVVVAIVIGGLILFWVIVAKLLFSVTSIVLARQRLFIENEKKKVVKINEPK